MNWSLAAAPPEKIAIARTVMDLMIKGGLNSQMLDAASAIITGDTKRWHTFFADGERSVIWFISEVSDASMEAAFAAEQATATSEVIMERFAQNADLKPFVRKVMLYDFCHPLQAVARMQRTARAMVRCNGQPSNRQDWVYLTRLNVVYTALVFVWLYDSSPADQQTARWVRTCVSLFRL